MHMRRHFPDRLVEAAGGFCASLVVLAMVGFAIAEMVAPLMRLARP
jgi:hypothetical protein